MSSAKPPTDPLQNLLDEAESELSRRLHEACEAEAHGVSTDSTAEIRRLEDTLLQAVMAAERTIAARRHLEGAQPEERAPADPAATAAPAPAPAADAGAARPHSTAVRVFEDQNGRRWRAWPVIPDVARAHHASSRSLGDFRDGWICFEALDNSGRRRLPGRGRRWSDLPAEELLRLLGLAITVPPRKSSSKDRGGATPDLSGRDLH
jgi:hypothetical protein